MQITCPHCGFEREVEESHIPPRAKLATCPKCGVKFQFRELPEEEAPQQEAPEPQPRPDPAGRDAPRETAEQKPRPQLEPDDEASEGGDLWDRLEAFAPQSREAGGQDDAPGAAARPQPEQEPPPGEEAGREAVIEVPFEDPDNFPFVGGFTATVRRALLHPKLFFGTMPTDRGTARTLLYFLIVSELLAVFMFLWVTVLLAGLGALEGGEEAARVMTGLSVYNDPVSLVIYPLVATAGLYVRTGVTHLVLMLLGQNRGGVEGTFRAFAYGATPYLLAIFPGVGLLVGGVLSIIYTVIGLMKLHRMTASMAALAYILPVAAWFALMYLLV